MSKEDISGYGWKIDRTDDDGNHQDFESKLTYNAIFNGDVHIQGNLVVDLNTTSRDTVVETTVYQYGLAIPSAQILRLSDNSGTICKSNESPLSEID